MAKLAAYRAKRDFKATPEPEGEEGADGSSVFVVQKHDASRLHYDLRLELDGVMKSWAVTRGPSLVPGEKRLAVHVEDHPVAYNTFEGTIPKGQYGGGTVLLWDRGSWVPEEDPHRGYRKGHLRFRLEGEKLRGSWHLVRIKARPGDRQEAWLLIKSEDEAAREAGDADILEEMPLSVATGRDLDAIAAAPDGAVWESDRAPSRGGPSRNTARDRGGGDGDGAARDPPAAPPPRRRRPASASGRVRPPGKREGERPPPGAPMPTVLEPCLATLVAAVPRGAGWIHEIKWDGYRLVAFKQERGVRLATRRGHDWTHRFPSIADAVAELPVGTAILDGEAVILGEGGIADFAALQDALSDERGGVAKDASLYAFDLLHLDGVDLRGLPIEDRKDRLAALVPADAAGHLRLGEAIEAEGDAMWRSACSLGLEGVVSKRRGRPYRSGRSDDWVKCRCTERQEFAVLGHVPSSAAPRAVGSLVLGYREGGTWRHAGRAGTGYTAAVARDLWKRLQPLKAASPPPLAARPTAEERRGVVWAEPRLVAEIEFRGWTGDDRLRHAAFKGLREDKDASEVVRERPKRSGTAAQPEARPAAAPSGGGSAGRTRRPGAAEVAGVSLTHPDRLLWADAGLTKQGLAEYYEEVAGWVLPHVAGRPLSLVRCPQGAEGKCFFQKHAWAGLSDRVGRETVRDGSGGEEEVLFVRDLPGLVELVQASVLEIHPWGARMRDVDRPDRVTMDLDPGEGVDFAEVVAAAAEVRERLRAAGLESFCKTTGGKGLHVVVPLSGRDGWGEVKGYAKALADGMSADSPARYIAKSTRSARRGLIYVDYLRNGRGATAIAAYSTRARAGATVSVPVSWDELGPGLRPDGLAVGNLPGRLAGLRADPWSGIDELRQSLPRPSRRRAARRS